MSQPSGPPLDIHTDLSRDLGLTSALAIGIGTMIAAGIFTLSGRAVNAAGPRGRGVIRGSREMYYARARDSSAASRSDQSASGIGAWNSSRFASISSSEVLPGMTDATAR